MKENFACFEQISQWVIRQLRQSERITIAIINGFRNEPKEVISAEQEHLLGMALELDPNDRQLRADLVIVRKCGNNPAGLYVMSKKAVH